MNPLTLPQVPFVGRQISRLICGGNPIAGFSHISDEVNGEMRRYFTMANVQKLLNACWKNGITTVQFRGDRFFLRALLEHQENGGKLQWIGQLATEMKDPKANILEMAQYRPIAIYVHGTYVDNTWHEGHIDQIADLVKFIKDQGLPAGLGSHIPAVIEHAEEHGWETDFYMACFYNLAKGFKPYQATATKNVEKEEYLDEDRDRMAALIRRVKKTCLAFKILAAGRKCQTPKTVRGAFEYAFANIKPGDAVVVGMFPKHKNQVRENASIVRSLPTR